MFCDNKDPGSVESTKEDPVCTTLHGDQQWMELFNQTVAITDIDLTKYKVIFFAGGHGPMFDFPNNDAMNNAAAKIFENGGIVAGVCHGVVGMLITLFNSIYSRGGFKIILKLLVDKITKSL